MENNSEALSHFRKAREIYEKVASDAPEDLTSRFRVITYGAGVAGMQARLGQIEPALQECRLAVVLLREIREDATNTMQRFHRAEAYEYLAYAFNALAASSKASTGESRQYRNTAREMFQEALNVLEDVRSRGALDPASAEWATTIAAEIAKCDAALEK
jgi:tetratricopeptide (TPR) repeat protein